MGWFSRKKEKAREPHDVWMAQLLQKRYFSNGRSRNTLVLVLEADFLHRNDFSRVFIFALVNDSVGSLSQFL